MRRSAQRLEEMTAWYATVLAGDGIKPYWCINHGLTTSLYYRDPDDNAVEFQVNNFASSEEADRYMQSAAFADNPIGVIFDPDQLLVHYKNGEPVE